MANIPGSICGVEQMQLPPEDLLEQFDEIEKGIGLTLTYIKHAPDTLPTVGVFNVGQGKAYTLLDPVDETGTIRSINC